ncbi:uncharacterized G-patch domain protein DDB_G0278987-like [Chironomus tepperi]|uniref:uncharacterized G-patch domain protein DDB_G0278987-like n=1 Tax=Chironomus tepperi TaxID=113505 RepID=UPI00391F7ECD
MMTNQEAIQRINDSTVQKLMAIVENHNRNYRDPEVVALREEIDKIQKEIEMLGKIIKVKEDLNQDLTRKFLQIRLHCKIHVETKEHQIKRLNSFAAQEAMELMQAKMYYRHAIDEWKKKEHRYVNDIQKMDAYVNDLHLKLERSGIFGDKCIEESDEYESEVDSNNSIYRSEQYASDSQFGDDYDDQSSANDEKSIEKDTKYQKSTQNTDQAIGNDLVESSDEPQYLQEEIQCSEVIQDVQHTEDQLMSSDSDKSSSSEEGGHCSIEETVPQESNWCDIMEADQHGQSIEPVHFDSPVSESTHNREDEESQQASSNSNTETGDKVLESEEVIEPEVHLKINLNAFVHDYGQVKREKLNSKPRKQRQQKLKSKPKYLSLISFGGY